MNTVSKMEWVVAAVLLGLGLTCLFFPYLEADLFFYLAALLVSASAVVLWVDAFRKKRGSAWLYAAAASILALFLWFSKMAHYELIILVFAFYMLFCFLCMFIQFIINIKDKASTTLYYGLMSLMYLVICVLAFAWRARDARLIMRYFGLYLLVQAIQIILEKVLFDKPSSSRAYHFSHWTSLPVYVVSFLPYLILRRMLDSKVRTDPKTYDRYKAGWDPQKDPVNLRVFIHSGLSGEHMIGHMTFAYKGLMFSYGNYDVSEEKLFRTVGPGIFFTVPADIYVNNSCIYEGSTLFEYGLHIDEEQEQKLIRILYQIFDETYRWYCPIEKEADGRKDFKKFESDYASRLSYRTGAKYRKFYHGQWKTYWILGDNCSLFAEDVLSQIGCNIVHKNGIVSPGEYFEFFESAFADPSSNVCYRSWHDASMPDTLFPTLA